MQLSAVLLARILGFVELASLNPEGHVFFPSVVPKIVERFNFQKYPTKLEEFDESKGVEFLAGHWNGINVPKMVIYFNGFLVDTQSSTDDSERVLLESLSWANDEFGLSFAPNMIYRKRHLSNLIFQTNTPILDSFSPVANLKKNLAEMADELLGERIDYGFTRLDVDFERFQRQAPIAAFTIQRRQDSSFRDNKYYSEAPLPTAMHWQLLEQFEKDVVASMGTAKSATMTLKRT